MKNDATIISIIIPVYNREKLMAETLDSIISQTYVYWECIIIDDGSTDNTIEILKENTAKDKRIKWFSRPSNILKGVNSCRNYGLEKADGKFIQWFDSDDIMHPTNLEKKVNTIEKHNVNCIISNFNFFRGDLNQIITATSFNKFNKKDMFKDFVAGDIILCLQSLLWQRSCLLRNPFNENISYAEDIEFVFNQMVKEGFKFHLIDEPLVFIRKHDNSLTDAFKSRDTTLINDEISVRENIFYFLAISNYTYYEKKGALKMYLKSLKYLLYSKKNQLFLNKLHVVFWDVGLKLKYTILKLFILAIFFIFTKKGITAYQKILNRL